MNIHLFAIHQLSSALLAFSSAKSWVDRWVSTRSTVMDDDVDEVTLTRMSHTSKQLSFDWWTTRRQERKPLEGTHLIILE